LTFNTVSFAKNSDAIDNRVANLAHLPCKFRVEPYATVQCLCWLKSKKEGLIFQTKSEFFGLIEAHSFLDDGSLPSRFKIQGLVYRLKRDPKKSRFLLLKINLDNQQSDQNSNTDTFHQLFR
jgi:hypothetical protein